MENQSFECITGNESNSISGHNNEFHIIEAKSASISPLSGFDKKGVNTENEYLAIKWNSKSSEVFHPSTSIKAREHSKEILQRNQMLDDEITAQLTTLNTDIDLYESLLLDHVGAIGPDMNEESSNLILKIGKACQKITIKCINASSYGKMEEIYQKGLKFFTLSRRKDLLANYYDIGGEMYRKMGNYPSSLTFYQMSQTLKEEISGKQSASVAMTLYETSTIYLKLCKFESAKEFLDRALAILKLNQEENLSFIVQIYLMQCTLLLQDGLLFEAETLLHECQETIKDFPDKSLAKCIDSTFLDLYIKRRDHKKVKEILEENYKTEMAKEIRNPVKIAKILRKLGSTNTKLGYYNQSIENLKTAFDILIKIFGEDHPEVAAVCYQLGDGYLKSGQYDKAQAQLENSIKINQKLLGPDHPSVSSCYHSMGNLFYSKKEYSKALEHYELSFHIDKLHFPEGHCEFAETYKGIGDVYRMMGRTSEAKSNYEKVLVIKEKMLGCEHSEVKKLKKLIQNL